MLLGLLITVVLALAGAARLAVLGQRAATARPPVDLAAGDRPALVHLVLTRCRPHAAGYEATILAVPKQVTFHGQVVARWQEEESSGGENEQTVRLPMLAIDDGQQSWTCLASAAEFGRAALGDLVQVTVNPRSGTLASLAVTSRTRPEGPSAARPAPLVTPEEAAAVVGPVTRTTGVPVLVSGGLSVIYQGRDGTLSVIVAGGGVAGLNAAIARRMGTPLPGIGDQAWLLNRERTVIVQVGLQVTKLTASKSRPGSLPVLASVVAGRLAAAAPPGTHLPPP